MTILGGGLVAFALVDLVMTAFGVRGGGPASSRLSKVVWKAIMWTHARWGDNPVTRFAGVFTLTSMAAMWVAMELVGATVLFSAWENAVLVSKTGEPADWGDRLYFAGMALTTLGTGDMLAGSLLWRLVSVALAMTGFITFTLSIAYFVPLLDGVVSERQLAALIANLGSDPEDVLLRAIDDEGDVTYLEAELRELQSRIARFTISQHAYPAVHYFRAGSPAPALAPSIARLDETLHLAQAAGLPRDRRSRRAFAQTRATVGGLVDALGSRFVSAAEVAPPYTPSRRLAEALNLDSLEAEVARVSEDNERRRRVLRRFLERDGRDWNEVVRIEDDPEAIGEQRRDTEEDERESERASNVGPGESERSSGEDSDRASAGNGEHDDRR